MYYLILNKEDIILKNEDLEKNGLKRYINETTNEVLESEIELNNIREENSNK
jgi:hypothetical protein